MIRLYFILSIILVGCASNQYIFKHVGTKIENPAKDFTKNTDIKAEFTFKSIEKFPDGLYIKFYMTFENISNRDIKIHPKQFKLMDDDNLVFTGVISEPYKYSDTLKILSKNYTKCSYYFKLPEKYDLTTIGSFRLLWNYSVGNRKRKVLSKFVRYNIEYIYRYRDAYPYYPYHWYHPYGRFGIHYQHRWYRK